MPGPFAPLRNRMNLPITPSADAAHNRPTRPIIGRSLQIGQVNRRLASTIAVQRQSATANCVLQDVNLPGVFENAVAEYTPLCITQDTKDWMYRTTAALVTSRVRGALELHFPMPERYSIFCRAKIQDPHVLTDRQYSIRGRSHLTSLVVGSQTLLFMIYS